MVRGKRYGYQLRIGTPQFETVLDERWIEIPRLSIALRGFVTNPAHGVPIVAFTLADALPARLEVFDVAGRRVFAQDVGALGPGDHTLSIGRVRAAGVYLLRLARGSRALLAKGCLID